MEDVWKKFEENEITHSAAHHLIAIMDLRAKRGYARVSDVARQLNITSGSASVNLKTLKAKGFVAEDENKMLSLSETGEAIAKAVEYRKQLCRAFFEQVLRISPDQAEVDACKIEHLISAETSGKLEQFMNEIAKKQSTKECAGCCAQVFQLPTL